MSGYMCNWPYPQKKQNNKHDKHMNNSIVNQILKSIEELFVILFLKSFELCLNLGKIQKLTWDYVKKKKNCHGFIEICTVHNDRNSFFISNTHCFVLCVEIIGYLVKIFWKATPPGHIMYHFIQFNYHFY